MTCIGSVIMEKDLPDQENEYSKEGTNAHTIASDYLMYDATADLFNFNNV